MTGDLALVLIVLLESSLLVKWMSKIEARWKPSAVCIISGIVVWLVWVTMAFFIAPSVGFVLLHFAAPASAGYFAGRAGKKVPVAFVVLTTSCLAVLIGILLSLDTSTIVNWTILNGLSAFAVGNLIYRSHVRILDKLQD